jgi:hypothetical protein
LSVRRLAFVVYLSDSKIEYLKHYGDDEKRILHFSAAASPAHARTRLTRYQARQCLISVSQGDCGGFQPH